MMMVYFCQSVSMLKTSLKRYFLTGLLVIIPIWGTILILKALFVAVDGILGDLLARLVPSHYVPGLGIAALIALVFVTGLFATNFMGRQIVKWWEEALNRVPLELSEMMMGFPSGWTELAPSEMPSSRRSPSTSGSRS